MTYIAALDALHQRLAAVVADRTLASHAYAPPQTETSAQRKGKST